MEFDHSGNSAAFAGLTLGSIAAGLLAGGVVDALTRRLQSEPDDATWQQRKYGRATAFFLVQCLFNIALLLALVRIFPRFTHWFQLSISGALFAVVLFSVQRNLADNALRITSL